MQEKLQNDNAYKDLKLKRGKPQCLNEPFNPKKSKSEKLNCK